MMLISFSWGLASFVRVVLAFPSEGNEPPKIPRLLVEGSLGSLLLHELVQLGNLFRAMVFSHLINLIQGIVETRGLLLQRLNMHRVRPVDFNNAVEGICIHC